MKENSCDEIVLSSEEYNQILHIQQQILQMLASHYEIDTILSRLCSLAEALLPNSVASIIIKDKKTGLMSILSAPSIPKVSHLVLANLKPGPKAGSCGNAVFRNEPQYIRNTFEDKKWEDIRQVAIDFNICSCWSMPIKNKEKEAIGSFALSSFEHRSPNPFHKKLLETASSIVSIVLQNEETHKRVQLFSSAMQNTSDAMIITNERNEIIEINGAIENIYGYDKTELLGQNPKIFASKQHNYKFYEEMWKEINLHSKWSGEIINKKKDGTFINQWMSITALHNENNDALNYLAIFTDLTELKKAQEKTQYLAEHEPLTKLYNKHYLEKVLNDENEKTLIILNINNFSYINTACGFEIGDEILIKISKLLNENFKIDTLCKINSDEFALVFNKEIIIVDKIAEIQNFFMNNILEIEKIKLNITFSYGAVYGNKNLLRKASTALKEAKENGKNRYEIFEENSNSDYSKREDFIKSTNLIKSALDNNQFIPFFQGIYDNKNKHITKYEALARIVLENKIISPFEFLEPARLSGLLPEITKVMIDKTLKEMTKNNFDFSINITEDDLAEDYLIDYLEEKSSFYKINANRIILEILEGVSSTGKKNHIKQLNTLKSKGFKIAIDDFGAEYSNFERILDLDVDFIKIDAKYIKNINSDKRSYEIVRAIAFFTKNVNIPCIAEFVHNQEVQNIVDELGITFSQGYHFSVPNKEIR